MAKHLMMAAGSGAIVDCVYFPSFCGASRGGIHCAIQRLDLRGRLHKGQPGRILSGADQLGLMPGIETGLNAYQAHHGQTIGTRLPTAVTGGGAAAQKDQPQCNGDHQARQKNEGQHNGIAQARHQEVLRLGVGREIGSERAQQQGFRRPRPHMTATRSPESTRGPNGGRGGVSRHSVAHEVSQDISVPSH